MSPKPVVVLGTGLAGYALAREFRKRDKTTELMLISRDHGGFYSKPQLSNALAGSKTPAMLITKSAEQMAAELGASVRSRAEVMSIDAVGQMTRLVTGEVIAYRDLVLALGADPIRLDLGGDASADVMTVNDLDDYERFAGKLNSAQTVAILGAGLIGCEFANDLIHRSIAPILIDPAPRVVARLLPPAAAEQLRQRLEAVGARFRLGVSAQQVSRLGKRFELTLSDGSQFVADLVLSAIGLRSRTALARSAGLAVNRGVVTDRLLATSAEHIYALGDCAEVVGQSLPFVLPLMQQARSLAATLSGVPTPVLYPAMPVTLKTPACPTVVCPPPVDAIGEWTVALTESGCEAQFRSAEGSLLGFALTGSATSLKQALAKQIPGLWT